LWKWKLLQQEFFDEPMPFLLRNQQLQSTERNVIVQITKEKSDTYVSCLYHGTQILETSLLPWQHLLELE